MPMNMQRVPNLFLSDGSGKIVTDANGQPVLNRRFFIWWETQIKAVVTTDESSTPMDMALNYAGKSAQMNNITLAAEKNVIEDHSLSIEISKRADESISIFPPDRRRVNEIEMPSTGTVYFGDRHDEGSWRIVRSGTSLVIDRLESGSWVTKQTIAA